jgi:hypothetical protein
MMEKSGCLQLTREDYEVLKNVIESNATYLIKASAVLSGTGLTVDELKAVLDSGEYRIVDAN